MKIKFKIAAMLAAVALFSTSCNKAPEDLYGGGTGEEGTLKVTLELPPAPDSKATASTAKPITTWAKSIKSVMVILTNTSGLILDARTVVPATTADIAAKTHVLNGIATGSYNVFVVANYGETGFSYTATNPAWTIANVKGKNISALPLNLATNTAFVATANETGHRAYGSPAEVFVGSQTGVTISADATSNASVTLTRAVSMFRTRIISTTTLAAPAVGNDQVNFANVNSDIRIRRVANAVNLLTPGTDNVVYPTTRPATDLVYSKGAFNTANPAAADYSNPTTMLGTGTGAHKAWKDVMVFPGGHATRLSEMFELIISGWAPIGYIPIDEATGQPAAALTAPALVYWIATVQDAALATDPGKVLARNQILEVDLYVNSAGYNRPPGPGSYGNLQIAISLADWGNISNVDIIM